MIGTAREAVADETSISIKERKVKTKKHLLACALAVGLGSMSLAGAPANVDFQPQAQLAKQSAKMDCYASMNPLNCRPALPPIIKLVVRVVRFLMQ